MILPKTDIFVVNRFATGTCLITGVTGNRPIIVSLELKSQTPLFTYLDFFVSRETFFFIVHHIFIYS